MQLVDRRVSPFRADARRIAAWSGAFALHVAVFGVLLAPIARPLLDERAVPIVEPLWMAFEPEPKVIPRQIERPRPDRVRVSPRTAQRLPLELERPVFVAVANPEVASVALPHLPGPGVEVSTPEVTESAHLRTRLSPPPHYPSIALRRKLEGTVVLRVFVSADGRATAVTIERSSGHRALDDAARRRVLEKWRFEPATRNGITVPAVGLLPIQFRLGEG